MSNNNLIKTVSIFEHDPELFDLFRYNLFSHQIEYNRKAEWEIDLDVGDAIIDETITNLRFYIGTVHDLEPNKSILGEATYLMAKRNTYHPVKQFIEKEKWDGKPRLDEWIIKTSGCEDNVYTREVSKNILIAAVNRVYHPGCKFDHMVVLEGPQGIGKSTMIEILSGKFYLDTSFDEKTNDLVDSISQALIVEISELSGMSQREVQWVRSFITRKVDRVRLPYVQRVQDFKRSCVFIGTHNPSGNNQYLRDDTGNRRFWPIECREIDLDYLKQNLHQIWAEAFYRRKEQYHITSKESLSIMYGLHDQREYKGPQHDFIEQWLRERKRTSVTMEDIVSHGMRTNIHNKPQAEQGRIWSIAGKVMKSLDWRKGVGRDKNYYPPPGFYTDKQQKELDMDL